MKTSASPLPPPSAGHIPLVSLFIALLCIPIAALAFILFLVEFARLIYGHANSLLLGVEVTAVLALFILVLLLRFRTAPPSVPSGFLGAVLDFFALRRWHPAVIVAFVGVLVMPVLWFVQANGWLFTMVRSMGRHVLIFSDVQAALDGAAVMFELTLVPGLPLVFALHLLCRAKPQSRVLPWLLVPLLFLITAVFAILLGSIAHFE